MFFVELRMLSTKHQVQSTKPDYSNEILSAAAVAQGEKSSDTIANAPSSDRWGDGLTPMMLASTAPAPKINAGI